MVEGTDSTTKQSTVILVQAMTVLLKRGRQMIKGTDSITQQRTATLLQALIV
jgi:hypothetical protein